MASCRWRACRRSSSRPSASRRAGPAPTRRSWRRPSRRRWSAGSAKSPGVTEITSTSSLGSTNITMQFDLRRGIDGAARDVQAALNAALTDLPGDLPTLPTIRKVNPSAAPILILALTSKTMLPSDDLRRRRQRHRAAHRPGRRRRRGDRQRRRAAGDARPGRSGRGRLDGREPGGRAQRDRQRQCRERRSAPSTAPISPTPSASTTSCAPCPNTRTWW